MFSKRHIGHNNLYGGLFLFQIPSRTLHKIGRKVIKFQKQACVTIPSDPTHGLSKNNSLRRDGVKTYLVEKEDASESDVEVLRDSQSQGLDDHSHVHFSLDTSYKVKCEVR